MASRAERTAERRGHWLHHFEQHEASGLSVKAYAAQHALSVASWYAARKRYVTPSPGPAQFARVVVAPDTSAASIMCRIHLPGGTVVELASTLDTLPRVLASVSAMR